MIGCCLEIAIGYVVWMYVPKWIKVKSAKLKDIVRVICAVVGILLIIGGVFELVKEFLTSIIS